MGILHGLQCSQLHLHKKAGLNKILTIFMSAGGGGGCGTRQFSGLWAFIF